MTITKTDIDGAITSFLREWNRNQWQQDNGEWASEEWESERAEYDDAVAALKSAIDELSPADSVRDESFAVVDAALEAVKVAAKALEDQVRPDESDYIAEGLIDPDNVSEEAEKLDVGHHWQGWDCREGWDAYRHGNSLYMRWWRDAYSGTNRHNRDLWVEVSSDMFETDEDEEETESYGGEDC